MLKVIDINNSIDNEKSDKKNNKNLSKLSEDLEFYNIVLIYKCRDISIIILK